MGFAIQKVVAGNGFPMRAPSDVNSFDSPGQPNVHHNSGHPRMARIGGIPFLLGPNGGSGDRIYSSMNSGDSWTLFDSNGTYSGALLSGPSNFIYRFWIDRGAGTIFMQKFLYTAASAGSATTVYSNAALTSTVIVNDYPMLAAHVDISGNLYVITHWQNGAGVDSIYVFKSTNGGSTWTGPTQVSDNNTHNVYCHLDSDANGVLYASWRTESDDVRFCRSEDGGTTWTATISLQGTGGAVVSNPTIMTDGNGVINMFMQGTGITTATGLTGQSGVFAARSTDKGVTWSGWYLVDTTCGYGDPGSAILSNGWYVLAIRSSNGSGLTGLPSCGDMCKFRLMLSKDLGKTWIPVDDNYAGERTGTRNHCRYQTWYNYGGPLEWCWTQYINSGATYPTWYDANYKLQIRAHP